VPTIGADARRSGALEEPAHDSLLPSRGGGIPPVVVAPRPREPHVPTRLVAEAIPARAGNARTRRALRSDPWEVRREPPPSYQEPAPTLSHYPNGHGLAMCREHHTSPMLLLYCRWKCQGWPLRTTRGSPTSIPALSFALSPGWAALQQLQTPPSQRGLPSPRRPDLPAVILCQPPRRTPLSHMRGAAWRVAILALTICSPAFPGPPPVPPPPAPTPDAAGHWVPHQPSPSAFGWLAMVMIPHLLEAVPGSVATAAMPGAVAGTVGGHALRSSSLRPPRAISPSAGAPGPGGQRDPRRRSAVTDF
jgi:hypothetical protein